MSKIALKEVTVIGGKIVVVFRDEKVAIIDPGPLYARAVHADTIAGTRGGSNIETSK